MRARRISLVAVLLLLVIALASASSREDGAAVPGAVKPAGAPVARTVRLALPTAAPVRARVGEIVVLGVAADVLDEARIPALGLEWPVGPGLEGEVEFVASRAGRFPVVLRDAERGVGLLVVR